jgi:NADH-quinone oxidoreductase subunit L
MPGVDMLNGSTVISKSVLLAIVLAPLLGAILAGLFGRRIGRVGAHSVTILGVAASFGLSTSGCKV